MRGGWRQEAGSQQNRVRDIFDHSGKELKSGNLGDCSGCYSAFPWKLSHGRGELLLLNPCLDPSIAFNPVQDS